MDEAAKHLVNQFVQVCINPALCPEDCQNLYRDMLDNLKEEQALPTRAKPCDKTAVQRHMV